MLRYGRHLVRSIRHHNSVANNPICIKFGRPVENHTPMTVTRLKSKPEIEFQYGGRLFSKTGSSHILTTD